MFVGIYNCYFICFIRLPLLSYKDLWAFMVKYIWLVLPLSYGMTDFKRLSRRWDTFIDDMKFKSRPLLLAKSKLFILPDIFDRMQFSIFIWII